MSFSPHGYRESQAFIIRGLPEAKVALGRDDAEASASAKIEGFHRSKHGALDKHRGGKEVDHVCLASSPIGGTTSS